MVNKMEEKDNSCDYKEEIDQETENDDQIKKRKRTRYFEAFISKCLKNISNEYGITANAKQQLNSSFCILAKEISNKSIHLTNISKKKTISEKEISNSVKLLLMPEHYNMIHEKCMSNIEKFEKEESKHCSRQDKAGILFPPSICEKFLRNFGMSKVMITKNTPIYLASVLEYISIKILEGAINVTKENNRIRITVRDLELTVRNDIYLDYLFKKCNLFFIGGGVIPNIHESLLTKKPRKKKKIKENVSCDNKKVHRFRPGTVSLREIKKFQKTSNHLTFAKFPFERYIRNIVNNLNNGMKISKDVFTLLQYYVEQFVVDFLRDANLAAIHSGRVKLMQSDIDFMYKLRNYDKTDIDLKK